MEVDIQTQAPDACQPRKHTRFDCLYARSGLPERWRNVKTLSGFRRDTAEQQGALLATQKYLSRFSDRADPERTCPDFGLFFSGTYGSGKSHLLSGLAHVLMENGWPVGYTTPPGLFSAIKATYRRDDNPIESRFLTRAEAVELGFPVEPGEDIPLPPTKPFPCGDDEEEMVEHAASVPVLILDDLGSESGTNWQRETLYRIVAERYDSGRLTFAATNLGRVELAEIVGRRITSRLEEMTRRIDMPHVDFRERLAAGE